MARRGDPKRIAEIARRARWHWIAERTWLVLLAIGVVYVVILFLTPDPAECSTCGLNSLGATFALILVVVPTFFVVLAISERPTIGPAVFAGIVGVGFALVGIPVGLTGLNDQGGNPVVWISIAVSVLYGFAGIAAILGHEPETDTPVGSAR